MSSILTNQTLVTSVKTVKNFKVRSVEVVSKNTVVKSVKKIIRTVVTNLNGNS